MSGSPLQTESLNTPEHVEQFWKNYEKHLNCNQEKGRSDCVVGKILENRNSLISMEMVKTLSDDKLFVNIPIVIDESFQPEKQTKLLDSLNNFGEKGIKNFTLLFGYTDDEGSWIASLEDKSKFGPQVLPNLTESEAKGILEDFTQKMSPVKKINDSSALGEHYLDNLSKKQDSESPEILSRLVTEVLADHYIKCPANIFGQKLFEKKAKVFQYHWNYKGNPKTSSFWATFSKVWCGEWMGSCHSFEMFALFGQPFLEPETFDDQDRIVSGKFIKMVSYFAHRKNLFWPSFSNDSKPFYIIDSSLNEHKIGMNLKENECQNIWYDFIV